VFVNRTTFRVYSLDFSMKSYDYAPTDMTALCPEVLKPGVVAIAYQRQPDTRIHFIRSDGVAVVLVEDPNEEVSAFVTVRTAGKILDVVVLPAISATADDQVYYVVQRVMNGQFVVQLEKWAQTDNCKGGLISQVADSFITQTFGSPQTVITGLSLFNGQQVVVWADGQDVGTDDTTDPKNWRLIYTVAGGQITLPVAATNVTVGLPYTAQFQSAKLGLATQQMMSPLARQKNISRMGLMAADFHPKGVQYGADFAHLSDMPMFGKGGFIQDTDPVSDYDDNTFPFGGTWTSDSRLCLQSQAPRPATILGVALDMDMNP